MDVLFQDWPMMLVGLITGYLSGSIPFGLLLTRMTGAGDLRSIGSGNIGATNVLRTGRKGLAATTLLLDALKGTLPVLFFKWEAGLYVAFAAGLGAFLGHLYPVWLRFKGGKGVATYLGVLLGLSLHGLLVFAAVWLTMAFLFRYSSLAALTAALVVPVVLWLLGQNGPAALFVVMSAIVYFKHRQNISRLLSGTESKIGAKG